MKASEHPGVVLTAFRMDGTHGSGLSKCGVCGRFHVLFIASAGLRAISSLPEREVVCANSDGPCFMALKAKKWLDALREAIR